MSEHERPLVGLDELARALEAHEGPPDPRRRPPRHAPDRRWTLAVAAGALAVGAGTGFALASTIASTADAGGTTEGFGFLPARGWNVMQSGSLDRDSLARAIAANVPIDPQDGLTGEPRNTLRSLPPRGVLLSVTFTARGEPTADASFPVRDEPLRLALAEPALRPSGAAVSEYRLRGGVRGTNVEARLYFGTETPSARALDAAQHQLNRLAVAAERVTLFARPTIADGRTTVELFGTVDNGRAGEAISIQAKDCGTQFFRAVAGTETRDGGGWTTQFYPRITTTLRAVWDDTASGQVTIRQRARPWITRDRLGRYLRVSVGGNRSFWGKRVLIQRRRDSRWKTIKTVVLTESAAQGGPFASSTSWAKFTPPVPRRTPIRAVIQSSQVKPCYLGGISQAVRW